MHAAGAHLHPAVASHGSEDELRAPHRASLLRGCAGAGLRRVRCSVVVWPVVAGTIGGSFCGSAPASLRPTTTRTVTATIPARATTTKFDSTGRLRRFGAVDWATGVSSAVVKRELYSSR